MVSEEVVTNFDIPCKLERPILVFLKTEDEGR